MSRPCSVCIDYDRPAIEQYVLEGHSFAEINRIHPNISVVSITNHVKKGHLSTDIVKKVQRASKYSMESILDTVQRSLTRAEGNLTKERTVIDKDGKLNTVVGMPDQYYAPTERVIIEASKLLVGVNVEAEKLRLEQSRLEQSKHSDTDKLPKLIDYIRTFHPELIDEVEKILS